MPLDLVCPHCQSPLSVGQRYCRTCGELFSTRPSQRSVEGTLPANECSDTAATLPLPLTTLRRNRAPILLFRLRNKLALTIAVTGSLLILAFLVWLKYQEPAYEVKKYNDIPWDQVLGSARRRVLATGTFLTKFDRPRVGQLIERVNEDPNFEVTLVLLNPNEAGIVEARSIDEKALNFGLRINDKVTEVNKLMTEKLNPDRKAKMTLKCFDRYPTIAVIVIDDDLYTYPYPYGETGADSTVLIFKNYKTNDLAAFFERHLNSIVRDAAELENGKCKEEPVQNQNSSGMP